MRKLVCTVGGAFAFAFSGLALAGGMVEGVDSDIGVAMQKANIGALKYAQSQGTCMGKGYGFAKEKDCHKSQDGKQWVCQAEYSEHKGSCPKNRDATLKQQIDSAIDTLNNLCSDGREGACAAAAAAMAG